MAAFFDPNSSNTRNLGSLLIPGIFMLLAVLKLSAQNYLAAGIWGSLSLSMVLLGQAKQRRWAFWAAAVLLLLSLVLTFLKARADRTAEQAQPAAAVSARHATAV